MATFYSNFTSSGSIKIEVEGGTVSRNYDSEFVKGLQSMASLLAKSMAGLSKEEQPEEVLLTCGMTAIPNGGFAVSLGVDKAIFTVRFSWGKGKGGGIDIFPEGGPFGK